MKKKIFTLIVLTFVSGFLVFAQDNRVEPNTCIKLESGTAVDFASGDLILESDATGDASLIDLGSVNFSGGGQTDVQRYLTEGKWHLLSSPITSAVSGMFIDDYLQSHAEGSNGWTDVSPDNYSLAAMQGYALWSVEASPTTEVFSGTTHTGVYNKSITQSGLGWNLVGNPYPSGLDWDAVSIPAELNGTIWLFDPTIGSNGDYVYYINGGGVANTTSQFVPSGQGFFVRSIGGDGTLTLDNSSRVHGGQSFYKNTEDDAMLLLQVHGNDITSQTAIRFNTNASQQVDRLFDVYKIISESPEVPVLFTRSENELMAINTLPSIEENEIVPLWFRAGTDGEYTIVASEIATFDNLTPIYLEDIEKGLFFDFRENNSYSFNYKSGEDKSFAVHFTDPGSNSSADDIVIYAHQNILHVNFPLSELNNPDFNARIMVFDVSGKSVLQTTSSDISNSIPLPGSNMIYIVKVQSDRQSANNKVFIQ